MKKTDQIRAEKHAKKILGRAEKKRKQARSQTSKTHKYRYKFAPADETKKIYGL